MSFDVEQHAAAQPDHENIAGLGIFKGSARLENRRALSSLTNVQTAFRGRESVGSDTTNTSVFPARLFLSGLKHTARFLSCCQGAQRLRLNQALPLCWCNRGSLITKRKISGRRLSHPLRQRLVVRRLRDVRGKVISDGNFFSVVGGDQHRRAAAGSTSP